MIQTLNLLFSQPPDGVTDEMFNAWYDPHVPEILTVPSFKAGQRFRSDPPVDIDDALIPFSFLAVYDVEGDFDEAMEEKEHHQLSTISLYRQFREVNVDGPELNPWLEDIRFAWWTGHAISPRVETAAERQDVTTLNLLFSNRPARISDEEYNAWYDPHVPEILSVPGFVGAQRFRRDSRPNSKVKYNRLSEYEYLCIYEIAVPFDQALREMDRCMLGSFVQYRERKKNDPSGPPVNDWLEEIEFAWWNGQPLGERIVGD